MRPEHVISDEVFNEIQSAILRNEDWLAYNSVNYFLGKTDVYFFKTKEEAQEFSDNNLSEHDDFNIIHYQSVADVLRQIPDGEYQNNILSLKNNDTMNEQNFDYLKNQLKYTGFGEDLQRELREKMATGAADFTLMHKPKFGEEFAEAMLHFKKSEQGDMYFFNRYFLKLQTDKPNEAITQSFRVGRENNITLKEAYNLMQGRSVYKELQAKDGEKYQAWLQLNFKETNEFGDYKIKQFHENYGYNLKETLSRYQIKEMQSPQMAENLLRSLERGNRQQVTVVQGDKETKMFIEASPQFKTLNVYNSEMLRVNLQAEKQSQSQNQAQSEKMSLGKIHAEKNIEKQSDSEEGTQKEHKKQSRKEKLNGNEDESHSKKRSQKVKESMQ